MTPPILRDTGSLLDCLNYEISDTMGYRRCDGYERYDGFADGGNLNLYRMYVSSSSFAGAIITGAALEDTSKLVPNRALGVVLDSSTGGGNALLTIALYTKYTKFPIGYALNIGGSASTVVSQPEALVNYYLTNAPAYYNDVRNYMSFLRELVVSSSAPVAGLHYSGKQLYKAVNNMAFVGASGNFNTIAIGQLFQHGSVVYRKMSTYKNAPNYMEGMPVGTRGPSITTVQAIDSSGTYVGSPISLVSFGSDSSISAHMVFVNNPDADNYMFGVLGYSRGDIALKPSFQLGFDDGGGASSPPDPNTQIMVYNSGGSIKTAAFINYTTVTSGAFSNGDAAGTGQLTLLFHNSPVYPSVGDTIRDATGTITYYTVDSVSTAYIPGTAELKSAGLYYQWGTYNFFATEGFSGQGGSGGNIWGTTGCSRAFWATRDSWGNIYTQPDATKDKPKYLSMHCRAQLALGFASGSVQLSAVGEPMNFRGVDGAQEAGMGDQITGLLEGQGTSTIVLCRGSVARLSGVGNSLQQETISGKAGAFDYTGVVVGGVPVFTNQNGVTTLEQSAAYGDFSGERASSSVSTRLNPKLVDDSSSFEAGGVVCAFPVRAKDQYRLVLRNGSVLSVAFTQQGPKIMSSTWGIGNDIRVPMAWSSEIATSGKEYIHVAWDYAASAAGDASGNIGTLPDPKITYRLDYGWGFDGRNFRSYFDIAHIFTSGGVSTGTVDKVRLHGMGYGLATLSVTTSSLETDYDMSFMSTTQDISMPIVPVLPYKEYSPVTSIVDTAGWGIASKIRIKGSLAEGSTLTEPPHTCQVIQLHITTEGAIDS